PGPRSSLRHLRHDGTEQIGWGRMRIVALALLLAGFEWLVSDQFSLGPAVRVAADRSANQSVLIRGSIRPVPLASLPDTGYAVRNSAVRMMPTGGVMELYRLLPNFLWPGAMMLLGGLLLFRVPKTRSTGDHR